LESAATRFFAYPAGDLAVIVSEQAPHEALSQKSGVDHARVINNCFRHCTVLPSGFGTVFNDDELLRKAIRSNRRQFLGNIEKLRGKTEMHLKIFVEGCNGRAIAKPLPAEGVGRSTSPACARTLAASANVRPAPAPSAFRCIGFSCPRTKRSAAG